MAKLRVLNQEAIEGAIDMRSVIKAVEDAYVQKSSGEAVVFPLIFYEFEPGKADMDIKSGYLKGADIFGLKLVSWFGENTGKGLPALVGTVMVLDSRTGMPLGILNGEYITCMRTGAAGGIGAKYLARKDSRNLLMVGSGHQAPFQIAATLEIMEGIERVMVYNPNSLDRAKGFCRKVPQILRNKFLDKYSDDREHYELIRERYEVEFEAVEDIEKAAGEADIIITATPSRKPLIMKEWIKGGTHISCIGADMEGKQELDEGLFQNARVFADDITQAVNVGECEVPIKKGIISEEDIAGEIGRLIMGSIPGRLSDDDITIYDSTGIALQDLITANLVIGKAEAMGLGVVVDL
ncbi:MAG: Ornithine cyclodeaminase [Firmicutes bacterium]|nr:Ornithine cyclodeaminase [Bacillota bacterium]MDI6705948.1 ornithine cyclodeaminase family protein [Bacillota bacterium]